MNHHRTMQAARDRVFADYRMHIGEFVSDTHVPEGHTLLQQRLDVTEAGAGKAITLLDTQRDPEWLKQVHADAVAKSLGFDQDAWDFVEWDMFDGIATPGVVIALVKWADLTDAEAFQRNASLPDSVRLRNIRVVRDYGMFDRREAPQYFAEVHAKS
jgi:hypothetical protein